MMKSPSFKLFLLITILATLLSGCAEQPYHNISNEQLKVKLEQDIPIYDIRRPDEWKLTGVVENSQLLTYVDGSGSINPDFMEKFTAAIDKDDPVILICRTGNRTGTLARHLVEQLGYTQVYNVRHGITSWIRVNQPVTQPKQP